MLEKPDHAGNLALDPSGNLGTGPTAPFIHPYTRLRPDGSFILRLTNASYIVQPFGGGGEASPIFDGEGLNLRYEERLVNTSAAASFGVDDSPGLFNTEPALDTLMTRCDHMLSSHRGDRVHCLCCGTGG